MNQKVVGLTFSILRLSSIPAIFVFVLLFASATTRANTWVWTGGGGANGNWNNSANWGSAGIPGNGDTVVFQGATGLNSTNNIAGLTLSQMRFISGGFNVHGAAFTLTNSFIATNFTGSINIYNTLTNGTADLFILVSNNITVTLYGNINGPVGVVKAGLGTLTYDGPGDDAYTGTTTVSAGTLQLNVGGFNAFLGPLVVGDGSGVGSPTVRDLLYEEIPDTCQVTINTSGLLDLNNYNETIGALTLSGATVSSGTGTLTLSSNSTITLPDLSISSISGNLNNGSGTLTIQGNGGGILTFYASVSGLANIVQNDRADTVWYGSNSYSGNFTVNANGYIFLANSFALGNVTNKLTMNGSSLLDLSGGISITNQTVTLNSDTNGTLAFYGSFYCSGGSNFWQANFVFNNNCTVRVDTNCALVLNAAGFISGPGGFTKIGPGSLTLGGPANVSSYAGNTTVNEGTLFLNSENVIRYGTLMIGDGVGGSQADVVRYLTDGCIYGGGGGSTVVITNSGWLDLNGFTDDVGPIYMDGATITTGAGQLQLFPPLATYSSTNGFSTISGNFNLLSGTETLAISNDLHMSAIVSGVGTLAKTGPGTLYLFGANTYTGPTLVQQGWLRADSPLALGSTNNGTIVSSGATLVLEGSISITNEPLTLNGPGESSIWGSLDVESGVNTWMGPVTNNANSTLDAWNPGSELHINGPISGAGGLDIFGYSLGGGTVFYEGFAANTYAGLTTVDQGGTLTLSKPVSFGSVPGNSVISGTMRLASNMQMPTTVDVLVNGGGLFDFGAYFQYVDTLRGTGTVNFGTGGWIYVGLNSGSSEFDGNFTGVGYSPGWTVGKTGSGTFTIGGNSTYLAGFTHVLAGTLLVNGSQFSIPVQVDLGATLGGSGTVGSITNSGTVSPGVGGPGILTCSNLIFTSSGEYLADLDGPTQGTTYDLLNPLTLGGSIILGNAALQVVPNFTSPVSIGQQFTIIRNATPNLFSGIFSGLPEGSQFTANGYTFRISYVGGTGNDVVLTLLGIPGNTVTVNAAKTGWYDNTGYHDVNPNYAAGSVAQFGNTNDYRNFFVFNVPVSSNAIVHAELFVSDYQNMSSHQTETYVLRKVATPISVLEAGGSGLTGIYNGLATGAVYAVRSIATNESGQKSIIPLNAQFMKDAMAASGGKIALGGSVATLDATFTNSQTLFGYSGSTSNEVQLRLVYGTNLLINAADSGWYDATGSHSAGDPNFFVGEAGTNFYRNFFVYNLPPISSQLVDAQLLLDAYTILSPSGVEGYQLYDVTNSIAALMNNQTAAANIYADLGSGSVYGGRDVYVAETNQTTAIPLNGNFLAAAQANSGGRIALGGALTSLVPTPNYESLFDFSAGNGTDSQLWLGYYTEPISTPSFVNTPVYLGSGQYQFTLSSAVGSTNEIQASFDFQRWDYITDVKLTSSPMSFVYTNNATVPYRFFRAEALQ